MDEQRPTSRARRTFTFVRKYCLCVLALIVGFILCFSNDYFFDRLRCGSFNFINQNFACKDQVISKSGYILLQNDINEYIDSEIKKGDISGASLFFRDLRNGPIFGINDNDKFTPASLLKLPLAIAYFDMEEDRPGLLDERIVFSAEILKSFPPVDQGDKTIEPLVEGNTYTVRQLLEKMLKESDNESYYVLATYLGTISNGYSNTSRTFQELGIVDPRNLREEVITPRNYASLFRLLYNASYLSPEDSDDILGWLSQATYKDGLFAGVPENVQVSHKFGDRLTVDGKRQLHDCGIIYFPRNPYSLCVMTKGTDKDKMSAVIRTISKMTYDEVNRRKL